MRLGSGQSIPRSWNSLVIVKFDVNGLGTEVRGVLEWCRDIIQLLARLALSRR